MKVKSLEDLQDSIDKDLFWRKKELTTLKFMLANTGNNDIGKLLTKMGIGTLYSHWEGHIKHASRAYIVYLNSLKIKYSRMTDNFIHISLGKKFSKDFSIDKYDSQKNIFDYIIAQGYDDCFKEMAEHIVQTKSNLNFDVLSDIMNKLGLKDEKFETRKHFINETLLGSRNPVSHGEYREHSALKSAYDDLQEHLPEMISHFSELIKCAAENKAFLKLRQIHD